MPQVQLQLHAEEMLRASFVPTLVLDKASSFNAFVTRGALQMTIYIHLCLIATATVAWMLLKIQKLRNTVILKSKRQVLRSYAAIFLLSGFPSHFQSKQFCTPFSIPVLLAIIKNNFN